MIEFSRQSELTKAIADSKLADEVLDELKRQKAAEMGAITDPLAKIINDYIFYGCKDGKIVAKAMLHDSEKIVAILAPDLIAMLITGNREINEMDPHGDVGITLAINAMFKRYVP